MIDQHTSQSKGWYQQE